MSTIVLRKYGQAGTVVFPLTRFGFTDLATGIGTVETSNGFQNGDVKIIKDEGAAANPAGSVLPVNQGNGLYSLTLQSGDLQAARVFVVIIDQDNPKVWEDETIIIDTFGNPIAQHAFDVDAEFTVFG